VVLCLGGLGEGQFVFLLGGGPVNTVQIGREGGHVFFCFSAAEVVL
jgi:hypothetical protein